MSDGVQSEELETELGGRDHGFQIDALVDVCRRRTFLCGVSGLRSGCIVQLGFRNQGLLLG
jgi:hypothetical protein